MIEHDNTIKSLKEIIDANKHTSVNPTGRNKGKVEQNELFEDLLIEAPRMQMIRDKVVRVPLSRPNMTTPQKVQAILRAVFNGLDDGQEHAFLITLDKDFNYINTWKVGEGGQDHVHIDKAEFFKRVLATDNAACWIMAHNHPSGDPEPSPEDLRVLDMLKGGGHYLERPMRDFIILADGSDKYYSHRESNYEL